MTPDSSTLYTLFHVEHDLRVAQARSDGRVAEAAASHSRVVFLGSICRRIGGVLIYGGERLGGRLEDIPGLIAKRRTAK